MYTHIDTYMLKARSKPTDSVRIPALREHSPYTSRATEKQYSSPVLVEGSASPGLEIRAVAIPLRALPYGVEVAQASRMFGSALNDVIYLCLCLLVRDMGICNSLYPAIV